MKRFLKWVGYIFVAFVVSIIVVFTVAYINREEIKERIVAELNSRVNGTFSVEKINFTILHHFPDFSITLRNVALHDSTRKEPVLAARKIYLDIGLYALFNNEINMNTLSVDDGSISLYKATNGYSNTFVFQPKKDSSVVRPSDGVKYSVNIETIAFKKVKFTYVDSVKQKRIMFQLVDTRHDMKYSDDFSEMDMTGKVHCSELTFNSEAGGFLQNREFISDFKIRYHGATNQLTILPSSLTLDDNQILIDGNFLLNDVATYALHIEAKGITVTEGLSYVNNRIRGKVEKFLVDKPVYIDVKLSGKHNNGIDPDADVSFRSEKVNFSFGKLSLQDVTCTGVYLHRPDSVIKGKDESSIVINTFNGKVEGVGFGGNATFTKLADPEMDLSMKSRINHVTFNNLVDTAEWVSRSGTFVTSIQYKGKLDEYLDQSRSKYYGKLNGSFTARNGTFNYKPKKMVLKNVNAFFRFNEKQFFIDSLTLALNKNPLRIKGAMKNYIPFFIQPANKGYVTLFLTTPRLDLTFIASQDESIEKSRKEQAIERKKLTSVLNVIQQKLQFDVTINADKFKYKKFTAEKIKGQVKLAGDFLETSNMEMKVANGSMQTRLTFRHDNTNERVLSVVSRINGADIREFFTLFDDFGQKTILAENLAGNITATAKFSALVRKDFSIDPASMKGNISCNIREGRLINFEPLENISNFLFRKRDFSDVQFAELQSSFDVNGTDIDIDRMEVQSTVLSFFLQGRYSFTDTTSMSLQLPLSNLKKRDKGYKPENMGANSKAGMSVYLHIYRYKDIDSKINIAYDPFKKWVKARS